MSTRLSNGKTGVKRAASELVEAASFAALPSEVLVVGAGVSGAAAARALLRRGASVTVSVPVRTPTAEALAAEGAVLREGAAEGVVAAWGRSHPDGAVYLSPGVPLASPAAEAARAASLQILGELSLGARLFRGAVVAVTGSKGKSSLVKLLAEALSGAGRSALACGNYGFPFCAVADAPQVPEVAVVECSSFQLETADAAFHPAAGVLLNLSRDHLDRHGTMDAYRDAKLRLFAGQSATEMAFLPGGADPWGVRARFEALHPGRSYQTFGGPGDPRWEGEAGYFDNEVLRPAADVAAAVLRHLGLSDGCIAAAFRAFEPLPHRMQVVAMRGGVAWIDDSKATSLEALRAGVRMAAKPVFLIAGGRAKEPISSTGEELLDFGVAKLYTVGECGPEMARRWSGALPVEECETLRRAVAAAARDTATLQGGSVLLAPGTASFDQFRNFEERGDLFATLANHVIQP